jgi:hypothetical protein
LPTKQDSAERRILRLDPRLRGGKSLKATAIAVAATFP